MGRPRPAGRRLPRSDRPDHPVAPNRRARSHLLRDHDRPLGAGVRPDRVRPRARPLDRPAADAGDRAGVRGAIRWTPRIGGLRRDRRLGTHAPVRSGDPRYRFDRGDGTDEVHRRAVLSPRSRCDDTVGWDLATPRALRLDRRRDGRREPVGLPDGCPVRRPTLGGLRHGGLLDQRLRRGLVDPPHPDESGAGGLPRDPVAVRPDPTARAPPRRGRPAGRVHVLDGAHPSGVGVHHARAVRRRVARPDRPERRRPPTAVPLRGRVLDPYPQRPRVFGVRTRVAHAGLEYDSVG